MTISRRIMLLLTIALIALIGVGAGGLWQLGEAQFRFNYVQQNTFPSIQKLQSVRNNFGQMRVEVLRYDMIPPAQKAASLQRQSLRKIRPSTGALHSYQTHDLMYGADDIRAMGPEKEAQASNTDHQMWNADESALQAYRTQRQAYLSRVQAGDTAGALEQLGPLGDAGTVLTKALY